MYKYKIKDLEEIIDSYQNCDYGASCKECPANIEISDNITWCRFLILVKNRIGEKLTDTLDRIL